MPTQTPSNIYPKRGEIYLADLNPGFGREIHKKRPVLIISTNALNKTLPTVVVIPYSSIVPQFVGLDVVIFLSRRGLDKKSALIVNQIRSVDKVRLGKKIGKITKAKLLEVEESLKIVLGIIESN